MSVLRGVMRHACAIFALASAAASFFASIAPASAACFVGPAGTINCQGTDAAGGVAFTGPPYTTLNVDLTAGTPSNVTPGAGISGEVLKSVGSNGDGGTTLPIHGTNGDDAGPGGAVNINHIGGGQVISTTGDGANGIYGASIGGNGGGGGDGFFIVVPPGIPTPGIGGNGGDGRAGGPVTIDSSGAITTTGNFAHGILAESIGGNGGNGGDGVGVDGEGGDGGNAAGGGTVHVTSSSNITTNGSFSHGIFAQSVGGKGGSGGDGDGIVASGGDGGTTAPGAAVTVDNSGNIATRGANSYGILAQSVGGFGGAGGSGGGLVGFGSDGASAGNGGTVNVTNSGTITTDLGGSHAIFAQSVGGGGGAGGSGVGIVGLGASGSVGGAGSSVSVINNGAGHIATLGDNAKGIFAQSIGGGGGDGGDSVGLVAIGGSGSATSDGGTVTVTNSQAITTEGVNSQAIFAQSIGGGGGNGGFSVGLVSIGGDGGGGGDGSTVKVSNSGAITTSGDESVGVLAQSIGGGGGNGGFSIAVGPAVAVAIGGDGGTGGNAGAVIVNELAPGNNSSSLAAADITTHGTKAHGIQAQSIGGGGGNGGFAAAGSIGNGFSASVAIGGDGGAAGNGNTVTVNENGAIITTGDQSNGIFAQSVGGGGGDGGGAVAATLSSGYSLGFSMGGKGGSGGEGSAVTVDATGRIETSGALSNGILAQSVGGGGGNGGFSVTAGVGAIAASVALGANGGLGGKASDVTVTTRSSGAANDIIKTTGDGANGILAQSVGGGGGNAGFTVAGALGGGAVSVGLGGNGGAGSTGGTVNVNNGITISTGGNNATGILAQSIGGGGGNGGFSVSATGGVLSAAAAIGGSGGGGSNGGIVTVDNDGDITTTGSLSYGILAQSVGGGGGNGGFAVAGSVAVSIPDVPASLALGIAVGGFGGGASSGGAVTVDNSGSIETEGLGAHAIFAQSVGGGGGNGGFAGSVAMTVGTGGAVGVSVGGFAGGGGDAGAVDVTSTGDTITTHANGADGIHAQSVGGGGGDGGFAFAGAFGFGGEVNVNVAVAIGGFGGDGGDGGLVTIDNQSAITTSGDHSNGIFAQSVGGGGGNGGLSIAGTVGLSETAGQVGVTVGGFAGDGSTAGNVSVTNAGAIHTGGPESVGIMAQSIGGSGGNGGLALTAQLTGATKNSAAIGVAVGGGAGDGNSAGTVDVINNAGGAITTEGFGSHGIKAQSIGGGGGNGGMAISAQVGIAGGSAQAASKTLDVGVSVGGGGGDGGFGGTVHVTNNDSIEVQGDTATGIFAQSIGGGGGDAGGALTAIGMLTDSTNADSRAVNIGVSVGGSGGDGNNGGAVTVDNTGNITTHGVSGYGVFAQSVGGGGGIGGRANTFAFVVTDKCTLPIVCSDVPSTKNNIGLNVAVGGEGGGASDGGAVTVNNTGAIETFGNTSDGIYAQSVGAGGGNGGNGIIGTGELLDYPVDLAGIPVGASSFYKNPSVAVGGSGGSSGNGGVVDVTNNKNITTHGDYSNGIFAQSIGGGGGVGGNAVIGATGLLGLGGEGPGGGDGGSVTVDQTGGAKIETFGTASYGIFAESVGGGGGVAGNIERALAASIEVPVVGITIPALNVGVGLALGRGAGGGGDGGIVDVTVDGQIITHGDNSAGIFAHSVGGGGGVLGELGNDLPVLELLSWQIGSKGDVGNAGAVTVDLTGSITTAGNNATGIFAQSAAGKTDSGHAGTAGDVDVTVKGSVVTGSVLAAGDENRGLGSVAILAQSAADDNAKNGNVHVDIQGTGAVVQGGRSEVLDANRAYIGVGVWVLDGKDNTINNQGLITTLGGVQDGYAILATGSDATHTGGSELVSNLGTVTGSFDLGLGANKFTNETGSFLNSGKFAYVGDNNFLINSGRMSPGGDGTVMTTEVKGNWTQSAGGTYGVDLDLWWTGDPALPSKEADRVNVIGGGAVADLLGTVDLMPFNKGVALPGDHYVTIVHAEGDWTAQTQANLFLDAPPSAVAKYELLYPNPQDIVLGYHIDFSPPGGDLTDNETDLGDHINEIQLSLPRPPDPNATPNPPLGPLVEAIFDLPDIPALKDAYDRLDPTIYVENQLATIFSSLDFHDSLENCRSPEGDPRLVKDRDCFWASVKQQTLDRERTWANIGFDEETTGFSAGAQGTVNGPLVAGFGFSYERSSVASDVNSWSNGERFQGGIVTKARFDATTLSASFAGGYGWYGATRSVVFPGIAEEVAGKQDIGFGAAHVRASQLFSNGNWYLRPSVDFGATYYSVSNFDETGGTYVGMHINGQQQVFYTAEPTVELGTEFAIGKTLLRPYVRAGITQFMGNESPELRASFLLAPPAVSQFRVEDDFNKTLAQVAGGLDIFMAGDAVVHLDGKWQKSDEIEVLGGDVKVSFPF